VISFGYRSPIAHARHFGLELNLITVLALIDLLHSSGVIAIHRVVADTCHYNLSANFDLQTATKRISKYNAAGLHVVLKLYLVLFVLTPTISGRICFMLLATGTDCGTLASTRAPTSPLIKRGDKTAGPTG
jgi:hypothetical protein